LAAAVGGFVFLKSPWMAVLFGGATVSAIRQIGLIWRFRADPQGGLDAGLAKARQPLRAATEGRQIAEHRGARGRP
jgi:hypothetical protein